MNVTGKFFLATVFTVSIVGSVQAQNTTEGDYYAPGPTIVIHATPAQLQRNQQGDYYVGEKTVLSAHRMAALKRCTDGISFESDGYVECMRREGEAP